MSILNVSLPPAMKAFVAAQVHSGRYSSASDYMQTLIRADQHRRAEATLEAQLLDSLASAEDASNASPSASPGATSPTEGRTMALPLPLATAVADWLHTPQGAAQQAQPFLTKSQERAARKQRWLKAI